MRMWRNCFRKILVGCFSEIRWARICAAWIRLQPRVKWVSKMSVTCLLAWSIAWLPALVKEVFSKRRSDPCRWQSTSHQHWTWPPTISLMVPPHPCPLLVSTNEALPWWPSWLIEFWCLESSGFGEHAQIAKWYAALCLMIGTKYWYFGYYTYDLV